MDNINFYPSTYAMKEESFVELDKLAQYLNNNVAIKIEIEGHTAGNNPVKKTNPNFRTLGEEWNYTGPAKKLSKLRAEAVKYYLTTKGVNENRLAVIGYGADKKLIEYPVNNAEKNSNMRVEIKVTQRERNSTDFTPSISN